MNRSDRNSTTPPILTVALGVSLLVHMVIAAAASGWSLLPASSNPRALLPAGESAATTVTYMPAWLADALIERQRQPPASPPADPVPAKAQVDLPQRRAADPDRLSVRASPRPPTGHPTPQAAGGLLPLMSPSRPAGDAAAPAAPRMGRSARAPEPAAVEIVVRAAPADAPSSPRPPEDADPSTGAQPTPAAASNDARRGVRQGVQLAGQPVPEYPAASRRLGEQGTVLVEVTVTAAGEPGGVQVVDSSGFPRLDRAAVRAAREARYTPALSAAGRPVQATIRIPFRFELRG